MKNFQKNKKLIIVGIGSISRAAYEYFTHDSVYEICGFSVNKMYIKSNIYLDLPCVALEDLESFFSPKNYYVFVAIGESHLNKDREKIFLDLKSRGYNFASYVSSKAFIWRDVEIGDNCFILENNVLQYEVKIGNNVILWSGNHIGHGSLIMDNCFITSHVVVSGNTTIGENCFIGVNVSIADNVKIANDNFIGLGTVINKNTDEDSVYVGNPAQKSKVSAKRFCKVKD